MVQYLLLGIFGVGRRRELITAAALYVVGGLITGYAPDLLVLIIGRFLYGIGIGLVSKASLMLLIMPANFC